MSGSEETVSEPPRQHTKFDLLVVVDATASMGNYLTALRTSIPEILALSRLSGVFSRLGVIAYRDYSDNPVIAHSGWNSPDLIKFVDGLTPYGGGDYPEAAKTALLEALAEADDDENSETVLLWYADAPPHHPTIKSYGNAELEKKAFRARSDSAFAMPVEWDWIALVSQAQKKRFTAFTFTPNLSLEDSSFFVYFAQATGGLHISQGISVRTSQNISQLTMDVVLNWMGQAAPLEPNDHTTMRRFEISPLSATPSPTNELNGSCGYLPSGAVDNSTIQQKMLNYRFRAGHVPKGSVAAILSHANLAKRFADPAQTAYHAQVYASLGDIVRTNIIALTRNPVFGQLWRAMCKEAANPEQQVLLNAFSRKVAEMASPDDKAVLQKWLEDSFDATEEIMEMVADVQPGSPVVYLDYDADVELTRTELLEVSHSCSSTVLKKVAGIFTHLKVSDTNTVLSPNQPTLPLNLPPHQLFRTLPHLVVRGTLFPPRAAALTAVLALITSVPFLHSPATVVLSRARGTWLDIDVPENLSFECARLLLNAPEGSALDEREKRVYGDLSRYRFVELNLESTLNARVPWTPEKTREVGDRLVECSQCKIRRSVTLMSHQTPGVCASCVHTLELPVHNENESCWVECNEKKCRAQYVIERPALLRIRPKCFYCRHDAPCPWLECTRCTNRIIIPLPYRTASDEKNFLCPACSNLNSGIAISLLCETSTRALNNENGVAWLGYAGEDAQERLFKGRSPFKLFQAHGFGVFETTDSELAMLNLTLKGKKVLDGKAVRAQVDERAGKGDVEVTSCSLCFDEKSRAKLLPTCGRSGCTHRADEACLRAWYGKSEPGRLLNLMQLACPYCRRRPTPKILARHNPRAVTLCGVREALEDRAFYYAWCIVCGFAKRAQERACAEDWDGNIENFQCEECRPAPTVDGRDVRVTACPTCGVFVEKINGCNHITCTCGTHFCHACGLGFNDAREVYTHMAEEHGGYYYNQNNYDDPDDEEEEEEEEEDDGGPVNQGFLMFD